jgi:hypothetical protein
MSSEEAKAKSLINAYPTKDLFISILTRDVTLRDAIGDPECVNHCETTRFRI